MSNIELWCFSQVFAVLEIDDESICLVGSREIERMYVATSSPTGLPDLCWDIHCRLCAVFSEPLLAMK